MGIALAEWCTRDRSPISEPLDIIKFICKELWTEAFGKGVDNLRTNHRSGSWPYFQADRVVRVT